MLIPAQYKQFTRYNIQVPWQYITKDQINPALYYQIKPIEIQFVWGKNMFYTWGTLANLIHEPLFLFDAEV